MKWHLTRRGVLGASLTLAAGSLAGCGPDARAPLETSTPSPTQPSPTETGGDAVVPGEVATRNPLDVLMWGAPLQMAANGQVVAALGFGEVIFWNTVTGRIASRTALEVDVFDAASYEPWSWSGPVIAVRKLWAMTAHIVDAQTGQQRAEVRVMNGDELSGFRELFLSPDGLVLASATTDGTIRTHSSTDGVELRRVEVKDVDEATQGSPPQPSFSEDGSLVISSSHVAQCSVQFWSTDGSEPLRVAAEISQPYHDFLLTPDGTRCVVFRKLGQPVKEMTVELRDGESFELIRSHPLPTLGDYVALHPAGTHVAWCGGKGNTAEQSVIHVMDLETAETRQLLGHDHAPRSLLYTPDGSTLISMDSRDGILAWDHASNTLQQVFELP